MTRVLRHNIRNKLGLVMGKADLLRDRIEDDDHDLGDAEIIETADQFEQNAREMVELSEKVRTIQERIRSVPESDYRTDVAAIARPVVQRFRARYPSATITIDAPGTIEARAPESYEVALTELIENGIEHYEGDNPSVHIQIFQDGDDIVTAVLDQAPEIPESERRVIREERETDLSHSAGVGLWLVYWVIKVADAELKSTYAGDGNRVEMVFDAVE